MLCSYRRKLKHSRSVHEAIFRMLGSYSLQEIISEKNVTCTRLGMTIECGERKVFLAGAFYQKVLKICMYNKPPSIISTPASKNPPVPATPALWQADQMALTFDITSNTTLNVGVCIQR